MAKFLKLSELTSKLQQHFYCSSIIAVQIILFSIRRHMAKFLKLSKSIINLEYVQQVLFVPEPPTVSVFWGPGYEETIFTGEDALLLMEAIDRYST